MIDILISCVKMFVKTRVNVTEVELLFDKTLFVLKHLFKLLFFCLFLKDYKMAKLIRIWLTSYHKLIVAK